MNLFQLVLKQMRQRALGTVLTTVSVVLGVALATAVLVLQREGQRLFVQTDFGFQVLVGPTRGSPLQLTLNTLYHLDVSPGLLEYRVYEDLLRNRGTVRNAIPIAKGDTFRGLPIVGTVPRMFNYTNDDSEAGPQPIDTDPDSPNRQAPWNYRVGKSYELAAGRMFHPLRYEAIIGADVPRLAGLNIGDRFQATHGNPGPNEVPDVHDQVWLVVGQLAPTGTAADRAIYIPLKSFFGIGEHEQAVETINRIRAQDEVGRIPAAPRTSARTTPSAGPRTPPSIEEIGRGDLVTVELPRSQWLLSAILVDTRSPPLAFSLIYAINNSGKASASNPATVMREFFDTFLRPSSQVLLTVAGLVSVVAALGILVAIYNSVAARSKEIAILRALGATRRRVLTVICLEAGLIGLIGSVIGVAVGLWLVWMAAGWVPENLGRIQPLRFETAHWVDLLAWWPMMRQRLWLPVEVVYLIGVVLISVLAGLVPALKAYRVPVATHLTS
ncbi:MAG: ABC transporter permease [Tepidisphaerales bacterium]